MGGQHFYYRITLVKGRGERGIFRVERQARGETSLRTTQYCVLEERATAERVVQLIDNAQTNIGSTAVAELTPKNPMKKYDYNHHFAI